MTLERLTLDGLKSYIREQITPEMFEEYLERMITEDNISKYGEFLVMAKSLRTINLDEETVYLLSLFLLYTETLTIDKLLTILDIKPDKIVSFISIIKTSFQKLNIFEWFKPVAMTLNDEQTDTATENKIKEIENTLLALTFAELEFFETTNSVDLPVKEYVRDYLKIINYSDKWNSGYGDIENVNEQLSKFTASFNDGKINVDGKYLCRFLRTYEKTITNEYTNETKKVIAPDNTLTTHGLPVSSEAEYDLSLANSRLNRSGKHFAYLNNIPNKQKRLILRETSEGIILNSLVVSFKVNSSNPDENYLNKYYNFNSTSMNDTSSFKTLSTNITNRTIHYKV